MVLACGSEELKLARRLRAQCTAKGVEINPQSTGKLLHELGRLYCEKSDDRFRLIQGIALMTSAILRNPENVTQIKRDLDAACEKVLASAGSKFQALFLDAAVEDVTMRVDKFRAKTSTALVAVRKIPDDFWGEKGNEARLEKVHGMVEVQQGVARTYTDIMKRISDYCTEALGQSPCPFALVGLGSLARKDITPFSDFEHAIVLPDEVSGQENYSGTLMYFRWFATLFQVILVRLGETLLSFLAIPSLNHPFDSDNNWFFDDFTVCGISPDGMAPTASKTALGCPPVYNNGEPSDLIKPCREMVSYLRNSGDFQRQLLKPCYVSGDEQLFETFRCELDRFHSPFANDSYNRMVSECFQRFDFSLVLRRLASDERFDVKRILYRSTTMFVAALGRYYDVEQPSCFDIVDRLHEMGIMEAEYRDRLKFCVAVSCEIRLRFYAQRKSQDDIMMQAQFYQERRHLQDIVDSVGTKTLVEAVLFTYMFQKSFSALINSTSNFPNMRWVEAVDLLLMLFVCQRLKLYEFANVLVNNHPERLKLTSVEELSKLAYYEVESLKGMSRYAEAVHVGKREWRRFSSSISGLNVALVIAYANSLHYNRMYKAALRVYRKLNYYFYRTPREEHNYITLYGHMSACFWLLGRYTKGLKYAELELAAVLKKYGEPKFVAEYYDALYNKAMCLRGLGRYNMCVAALRSVVELKRTYLPSEWGDIRVKQCLLEMAASKFEIGHYQEALDMFDEVASSEAKSVYDYEIDMQGYRVIKGNCLLALGRCEEAMETYKKAEESFRQLNLCRRSYAHQKLAMCWHQMALGASKCGDHEGALEFYRKAEDMCKSCDMSKHIERGRLCFSLGLLHYNSGRYDDVVGSFNSVACQKYVAKKNSKQVTYHGILGECYEALGSLQLAARHRREAHQQVLQTDWTKMKNLDFSDSFRIKLKLDFLDVDALYNDTRYDAVVVKAKMLLRDVSRLQETRNSVVQRISVAVYMCASLTQLKRYDETIRASESSFQLALQACRPMSVLDEMTSLVELLYNLWRCRALQGLKMKLESQYSPLITCHIAAEVKKRTINEYLG